MPATFARHDTMLGLCEALGQDLRVPPLLFRLAFAAGLFWSPWVTIATYLALALAVGAARWLTQTTAITPVEARTVAAHNDDAVSPTRLAA